MMRFTRNSSDDRKPPATVLAAHAQWHSRGRSGSSRTIAASLGFTGIATLFALGADSAFAQDRPGVPWLGAGQENILLITSFNEDVVRSLLPEGLEPVEGATGGIDIFTMAYGWPDGAANVSYIWFDVQGYDAPDGTPGSYVISWQSQDEINSSIDGALGWLTRAGGAELEQDGDIIRGAVVLEGAAIATVELEEDPESCAPVAAEQTYLAHTPDGALATTYLVWGAVVCEAALASFSFGAPQGDVLAGLEPEILVALTEHNVAWALSMPTESVE